MSGSNGTLSSLLSYRFVKKQNPKLQRDSSQQSNGQSRASENSSDSQATIPYNSQQSVNSITDSQETVPYGSQCTVSPRQVNGQCHSGSTNTPSGSPVFNKNSTSSPVFKSSVSQQQSVSPQNNQPWISKSRPLISHSSKSFVKRPKADNDSEDEDFGKGSGIRVDKDKLERLKEMFPGGDIRRMKAALFAYDKDFSKAVEFVRSGEKNNVTPGKRPNPDQSDELPEITGSRKRIKIMPDTPSPTKESGFSLSSSSGVNQESVTFLKECFPQKSIEHIVRILKENDGCTERASIALASEGSGDEKLAASLASSAKPQSSTLMKAVKEQKAKANGSAKHKKDDYSDEEEDEYDEEYDSDDSEDLDNKTTSEIDNFLQFFEEATVEELGAMPGCSKKKAELIITLRPFESWEDLCIKFDSTKPLSTALISGCKEIMRVRNIIRRLMMRCESMSKQMETVVATLTRDSQQNDLNDDGRIARQPEVLTKEFSLKPYQLIGLSWLRLMHEQELNGILADEMGLGKTIQAISFLAHLLDDEEEGPHVIIVPSSTIENWLRELQTWCPALKVIVYYGSQEERRAVRHSIFVEEENFNVLLTTYNMATGGVEDRVLFKKFEFHYAIFDEGHMLKNMSSLRFQNLMKIVAERRLLLTGTPLQNNLLELMSLLCFVMPEIFQGKTDSLKKMFTMISRSDDKKKSRFESERIAQAKRIMKPFVLRRLKKDVLSQLPKKTEKIMKCPLSKAQRTLYDTLVSRYAQEVEREEDEETSATGGAGVFMQFRKAANHPMLIRNLYTDAKLEQMAKKISKEPSHRDRGALPKLIQEDMSYMNDFELLRLCKQYKKYLGKFELDQSVILDSGKFRKLDELLPEMKEKGDRVLLFSQFTMMLDVMEHYLDKRQHKFIRLDGQTPVPDRLQLIDRFNNEPDIFVFLLSTRAGGLGINLVSANTIILHDIDFNPYNDKQAEDRCHRLGQKREVTVIKLIGEDTVDESMLRCANSKLALEKDLTGPEGEEESETGKKDVANLLKEVLKQRQKGKGSTTTSDNVDKRPDGEMIEFGDEESSNQSSDVVNHDTGLIEIGDEGDNEEDVS